MCVYNRGVHSSPIREGVFDLGGEFGQNSPPLRNPRGGALPPGDSSPIWVGVFVVWGGVGWEYFFSGNESLLPHLGGSFCDLGGGSPEFQSAAGEIFGNFSWKTIRKCLF